MEKHLKILNVYEEDIKEELETFSKTDEGKKFLKSLEIAKDFREKHEKIEGLDLITMRYLMAAAWEDPFKAISSVYDYSFKRGYMAAKRKLKKR